MNSNLVSIDHRLRLSVAALCCSLILTVVATVQRQSQARPLKEWTCAELMQHSDVVVIGRFELWKTIHSDFEDEPWRSLFAEEAGKLLREHIIARDATISVESVVKGKFPDKSLHVLLFGYKTDNPGVENGFRFFPKELAQAEEAPLLLLFLKQGSEGLFVPTTGHADRVDSVDVLVPSPDWTVLQQMYKQRQRRADGDEQSLRRLEEIRRKSSGTKKAET